MTLRSLPDIGDAGQNQSREVGFLGFAGRSRAKLNRTRVRRSRDLEADLRRAAALAHRAAAALPASGVGEAPFFLA